MTITDQQDPATTDIDAAVGVRRPARDEDPAPPTRHELSVDGLRSAIAPALQRLSATAADREQRRDYAVADVRALAQTGVALVGIDRADGGAGGTLREVVEIVVEIARADSNVAQALRATFLAAHQVATRHDLPHRDRVLARLIRRELFAGTANERSGGASGAVHATARRVPGGWVVDGRKYYSTGSVYATWFSGQAVAADGSIVRFTVPVDRDGVQVLDDFDAVGQRLTASGTTALTGVFVADDEVVTTDAAPAVGSWPGSFAQLYLAAVLTGIAARTLDDAVDVVRTRARPIKHSTAVRSTDDPYVRQTVGEIAARSRTARAVVLLAADELDRSADRPDDRSAAAAAAVEVAQAGSVAIENALRAAELLFDVGGGSITAHELGYDRHWRNARTVANHNPRQWKLAVAGAFHLTGAEPPTTGLF